MRTLTRSPLAPAAAFAVLAALAVLAVLATACSGGATASPRPSSPSATASPAAAADAAPSTPAQLALAAYTAMWADVQVLDQSANYTNPRLGDHLDGQAYMTISENMAANKAKGIIGLGAPVLHPRVLTASTSAVSLADCLDDRAWLTYFSATHQLTDNTPGGHRYVTATVADEHGTWKVTTLDVRGEGTCT